MKRYLASLFALLFLLSACSARPAGGAEGSGAPDAAALPDTPPTPAAPAEEYSVTDVTPQGAAAPDDNYRVFYEIFVGSFSDSDGDGKGDLRGIIDRLDYLNDGDDTDGLSLGIEGIWLSPVLTSKSYHKYDVDDYYAVDPAFGTEADLKELADACHERGIKLIMDMVINHTGTDNPWFLAFAAAHQNGDTADPYYDFYTWAPEGSVPGGRTFVKIPGTDEYYECNFSPDMPELNYDNDAVREAVVEVAKHYLDLGLDGFRFDAAKYIYFGDNEQSGAFWVWYIDQLKAIKPDIYTVAEVWDADGVTDRYFPALNCFNFTVSQPSGYIASAAKGGSIDSYTNYVDLYLDEIHALNEDAMMVPFIANHDTDRAAGYLTAASGQAQMAANLYILGPGSPFLYYGEELGQRGSRGGANTDANRRLKMEWGDGDTVQDPEGSTYAADNRVSATAAEQLPDAGSLYNYYKKLILVRKANPAIARGDYIPLVFDGGKAGGFVSQYEGTAVAVLHNPSDEAVTVDLADATDLPFTTLNAAVGMGSAALDGTRLTLDAQTSAVLGQ